MVVSFSFGPRFPPWLAMTVMLLTQNVVILETLETQNPSMRTRETTSKLISPHFFVFALAETETRRAFTSEQRGMMPRAPLHIRIHI